MIEGYGADLERWPCGESKEIAAFIESDAELAAALFIAQQIDQSVTESLVSAEVEWSPAAENRLLERIARQSSEVGKTQNKSTRRGRLVELFEQVILSMTKPLFPVGIATAVLLLFVIQLNLQDKQFISEPTLSYSTAELDDWLVFEGITADESLAELDLGEPIIFEYEAEESGFESEAVFFL